MTVEKPQIARRKTMAEETTTQTTETTVDYEALYKEMETKYSSLKTSFDKTSKEISEYKRKDRERLTDEERINAEREEEKAKYAELEKRLALRDYADELDDVTDIKVRNNIVELLADGKIVDALKAFKEFRAKDRAEIEKKIRAELLKQNPQPKAQTTGGGYKSKDEIMAIKDVVQRQKAIAENIHLFS